MNKILDKLSPRGILTLSAACVQRVLDSKNPDAAQLLLWIAMHPQQTDIGTCAQALGLDEIRFHKAYAVVCDAVGIEETPAVKAAPRTPVQTRVQSLPEYSALEIEQAFADEQFAFLTAEAERCLCRPLRRHETETLLALYEDAGIPADVLALVLTDQARRAQETASEGAEVRVSFASVRTEAMNWHALGIDTVEKAEQQIRKTNEQRSMRARVLKILGIQDRRPSPTELRYIDQFIELDPTFALIARAYDITVVNKGSLIWPYMRSILAKWHDKGYKTVADMEQGESRHPSSAAVRDTVGDTRYEDQVLEFLKNNEKV